MAAEVTLSPAQVVASERLHARASKYVANASPMPLTVRRTGLLLMTSVSMSTRFGFALKNWYSLNWPSSVYTTESAEHGASVAAIVGTTTTGASTALATALAVSKILPPPMPTTTSAPFSRASPTRRSISACEHSPLNSSKSNAISASAKLFFTTSPERRMPPADMTTRAFLP